MVHLDPHAPYLEVGLLEDVDGVVDRAAGDVDPCGPVEELAFCVFARLLVDDKSELAGVVSPVLLGRILLGQHGGPMCSAKAAHWWSDGAAMTTYPSLALNWSNGKTAGGYSPASRVLPFVGVLVDDSLGQGQHAVDHADIDVLPLTGPLAVVEGARDALDGHDGREDVADARPDLRRSTLLGARDAHDAAHDLGDEVEGRPVGVETLAAAGIAEAADRGVDQP